MYSGHNYSLFIQKWAITIYSYHCACRWPSTIMYYGICRHSNDQILVCVYYLNSTWSFFRSINSIWRTNEDTTHSNSPLSQTPYSSESRSIDFLHPWKIWYIPHSPRAFDLLNSALIPQAGVSVGNLFSALDQCWWAKFQWMTICDSGKSPYSVQVREIETGRNFPPVSSRLIPQCLSWVSKPLMKWPLDILGLID